MWCCNAFFNCATRVLLLLMPIVGAEPSGHGGLVSDDRHDQIVRKRSAPKFRKQRSSDFRPCSSLRPKGKFKLSCPLQPVETGGYLCSPGKFTNFLHLRETRNKPTTIPDVPVVGSGVQWRVFQSLYPKRGHKTGLFLPVRMSATRFFPPRILGSILQCRPRPLPFRRNV